MHQLGWFTCPSAFGATPRPALAYPCTNSLIVEPCGSHYASLKKEEEIGASHRPADPLGRPTQGWRPSIRSGAQGAQGTPLARVPLAPLRALPSSTLFALVSLQVHKKKKKKIFPFCILICISFSFRVYLLLFARTCLWWYYYPARTVL